MKQLNVNFKTPTQFELFHIMFLIKLYFSSFNFECKPLFDT